MQTTSVNHSESQLTVSTKGEIHNITFESPIETIRCSDANVLCSNSKIFFFRGLIAGVTFTIVACAMYMGFSRQSLTSMDDYTCMSNESVRRLRDQGIKWDVKSRMWVEFDGPSVTKLSPKPYKPYK
jgi:hypothetical protein